MYGPSNSSFCIEVLTWYQIICFHTIRNLIVTEEGKKTRLSSGKERKLFLLFFCVFLVTKVLCQFLPCCFSSCSISVQPVSAFQFSFDLENTPSLEKSFTVNRNITNCSRLFFSFFLFLSTRSALV